MKKPKLSSECVQEMLFRESLRIQTLFPHKEIKKGKEKDIKLGPVKENFEMGTIVVFLFLFLVTLIQNNGNLSIL